MRLKGWKIGFYWVAWIVCLGLLSCEKEALETPDDNLCLYIQVPSTQTTKAISDPGSATQEGEDWDRLAVIFVYEETNADKIIVKNISKSEFYNFPNSTDYPGFKAIPLYIDPGTVYIYGVTYSTGVYGDLTSAIEGCSTKKAVQQLIISNDYGKELNEDGSAKEGTLDYAKFLSVATGYYKGKGTTPAEYEIRYDGNGSGASMTLTRLAAKIDVQWDAADAYGQGYTDVKVTGFTFDSNNTSVTDTGSGRLFPALNTSSAKIAGNKTFYNTSEISQRNGRVYHYTFPDGVSVPSVKFNITANGQDSGEGYTLNFTSALQQATWYKVNATIKGITGSGTIDLKNE